MIVMLLLVKKGDSVIVVVAGVGVGLKLEVLSL